MQKLVLVRHGQSQWNLENRFTGWVDAPLTEKGLQEARRAGELIKDNDLHFKKAYTSYLQRAIKTLWVILDESDQMWIPVDKHWRLNERHYGGLQGLNKQETREKFGEEQVFEWRRSYHTPPPKAEGEIQEQMRKDLRYQSLKPSEFPEAEALKHCLDRVQIYWDNQIVKDLQGGGDFIIAAHGNSLRALVKILTAMDEKEITQFEFETGVPLVCDLTSDFKIKDMSWLKG
jgi:2,3-bisphosphoglycerate-dependent phosphoglycerate mutase